MISTTKQQLLHRAEVNGNGENEMQQTKNNSNQHWQYHLILSHQLFTRAVKSQKQI